MVEASGNAGVCSVANPNANDNSNANSDANPNNENFKWMLKNANKPSSVMGKNANGEYVLANGYIVRPKQRLS